MRLAAPFTAHDEHLAVELPGARALFTTRRGGVSAGPYASLNLGRWTDDDPDAVGANRERLAKVIGIPRELTAQGRQVHGVRVARVPATGAPGDAPLDDADGQATARADVACVVLTADCLPVAIAAEGAVAMVHAGWKGLDGGILAEGVRAVRELGGRGPLHAAIGPAAGACCYEVGDDLRERFGTTGRTLDLKGIATEQLRAAGAAEVHDAGLCTICADPGLFFSHRRDAGVTGRQAGIAWRS